MLLKSRFHKLQGCHVSLTPHHDNVDHVPESREVGLDCDQRTEMRLWIETREKQVHESIVNSQAGAR